MSLGGNTRGYPMTDHTDDTPRYTQADLTPYTKGKSDE